MDNFILSLDDLQDYKINLEQKYLENSEITDINEELGYLFSSIDNIYEIKAILRKNKMTKEILNKITKENLDKWFNSSLDITYLHSCNLNNYCKLNLLNEYFISVFSNDFNNLSDMNFSTKESEYVINGEIDISKISSGKSGKGVNYVYKKNNMLKGVERGLYRRNNDKIDYESNLERESITYRKYSQK